ncbi:hypothetical protein [Kocuria arenosa]|uniref:hypothetical protein n=1 Tax=Kocuria arenosa TaxID=3071446 RepID=UPI0034D39414
MESRSASGRASKSSRAMEVIGFDGWPGDLPSIPVLLWLMIAVLAPSVRASVLVPPVAGVITGTACG